MAKVKRSEFWIFINTTPAASATWVRLGTGVTSAAVQYNPNVTTEQYINEDNATISLESYAPTLPIEMTCINTNAAFEYLDTMRRLRSVLEAADTEILLVYGYETAVSTDQYPAEKQAVSVAFDSFGGDAGIANKINFTLNFRGNPTVGLYDVSANSFA